MKEQIRLWFYAQLFMSVVLTGEAPYKNVVGHSTIVDEDGKKFSKTGPRKIYLEKPHELRYFLNHDYIKTLRKKESCSFAFYSAYSSGSIQSLLYSV